MSEPIYAYEDPETHAVWRAMQAREQPHSLIPIVEDVSNEIDATEVLNEQGRLDPEVYDLL